MDASEAKSLVGLGAAVDAVAVGLATVVPLTQGAALLSDPWLSFGVQVAGFGTAILGYGLWSMRKAKPRPA